MKNRNILNDYGYDKFIENDYENNINDENKTISDYRSKNEHADSSKIEEKDLIFADNNKKRLENEEIKINNESVGRITFVGRNEYKVVTTIGEMKAVVKGSFLYDLKSHEEYPNIGDWVKVLIPKDGQIATITDIYKRKNIVVRKMKGKVSQQQIIACNVDNIILCISLNSNFSLARLERYMFAFSAPNAKIIIVLTKKDLVDDADMYIHQIRELYKHAEVIAVSKFDEISKYNLYEYLSAGSTSVLIGSSGVGKSTLINSLVGKDILRTNEINDYVEKGKHTTTFRKLLFLNESLGCIIDTPGMRSVSLWSCDQGKETFKDIEDLALKCKFRNCSHVNDKGCAIIEAVKNGLITEKRYKSYMKLTREAKRIEKAAILKEKRLNKKYRK